jgi:hypothetical protein
MSVSQGVTFASASGKPNGLIERPILPFFPQFIDSGISVKVNLPLAVNFRRQGKQPNNDNLPPLFNILVNSSYPLDVAHSRFTPISIFTANASYETSTVSVYGTGSEHPNSLMARTFRGYRGSMKFLIAMSSNAVTLGIIQFIRGRNLALMNYDNSFPDLNSDAVNACVLANLARDSNVVVKVPYDETSEFVDTTLFTLTKDATLTEDWSTKLRENQYRNFVSVRPITNLSTYDGAPSELTFKIFIAYGEDFEFLYHSIPRNMRSPSYFSVIDYHNPFSIEGKLLVVFADINVPTWTILDTIENTTTVIGRESKDFIISSSPETFYYDDKTDKEYVGVGKVTINTIEYQDQGITITWPTQTVTIGAKLFVAGYNIVTLWANQGRTTPPPYPQNPSTLSTSVLPASLGKLSLNP